MTIQIKIVDYLTRSDWPGASEQREVLLVTNFFLSFYLEIFHFLYSDIVSPEAKMGRLCDMYLTGTMLLFAVIANLQHGIPSAEKITTAHTLHIEQILGSNDETFPNDLF